MEDCLEGVFGVVDSRVEVAVEVRVLLKVVRKLERTKILPLLTLAKMVDDDNLLVSHLVELVDNRAANESRAARHQNPTVLVHGN